MEKTERQDSNNLTEMARRNLFQLLAVVVAVLNLWLATKLAPLSESVHILDTRVEALESIEPITPREFGEINNRLNRIESKLDNLISER